MRDRTGFRAVVTADLFRLADLFRRNLYASGYVPVFKELSGFVPGVPFPFKTQHSAFSSDGSMQGLDTPQVSMSRVQV